MCYQGHRWRTVSKPEKRRSARNLGFCPASYHVVRRTFLSWHRAPVEAFSEHDLSANHIATAYNVDGFAGEEPPRRDWG